MSVSFIRAPLRVLSTVGATRRAGRMPRPLPAIAAQPPSLVAKAAGAALGPKLASLASTAQQSLMCWWVEESSPSSDPMLAVQLDLYERRICLRGKVNEQNVDVLADVTATLIALNPGDSTVDISRVSVIDAAGLTCIAKLGTELSALGAQLQVVGSAARRRRFGLGGLTRLREAA